MEVPKIDKKKKNSHGHVPIEWQEEQWEMHFYELKKFKKKFGHCDVSLGRNNPYYLLGMWCNHQRHNKKFQPLKFSPDRERKLNAIGFSWVIFDKKFENKLWELKQFKKKYGHYNVSASEDNNPYFPLSCWVRAQRMHYHRRTLKAERIAKLNNIGFNWINPLKDTWDARFNELKKFKKKYGHFDVPKRSKEYPALSYWCVNQRRRTQYNRPDRVAKLNKIGFTWNVPDSHFEDNFRKLQQYQQKNGHCQVKESENLSLSKWCGRIRHERKKGTLKAERISRLTALGFEWGNLSKMTKKLQWEQQFLRLKEYQQKYGNYNVPGTTGNPNRSLAHWVNTQRMYYKTKNKRLMAERIAKLNSIEFNWINPKRYSGRVKDIDLLNELKRLYVMVGKPPGQFHINKYGKYKQKAYYTHFGSIPKAREAAGIPKKLSKREMTLSRR
jgi:Helicase associated domain/Homing endonuclease associated repeat